MAFYRKRADFHTIENTCEPFLMYMRSHCEVVKEDGTTPLWGVREAFILNDEDMSKIDGRYRNQRQMMQLGEFMELAPLANDYSKVMCYILEDKSSFFPTVSPTHIRLPKLSHLITLTSEDFFALFRILAAGRKVSVGNSFSLPGDIPIPSSLNAFFVTNGKTFRTNPDYCDRKWTLKSDIAFIAALEPSELNQLYAMQYLTARQNPDLMYFPVDSAVGLELEWPQITEDYVIPEQEEEN